MTDMEAHTPPRRDHLWVLAVIAACVLAEVWASWVGIGSISGFPRIGRMPTDWVLAVAMEAYWGYALYAWLVAPPGPRSGAMAMWSCAVVFVLSLIGQVLYHEITAPAGTPIGRRVVIGFVTSLPVIVLALIAVLIHFRHLDRAEAVAAERRATAERERITDEAVAADDRVALRAELEALREEMSVAETARGEAERREAEAFTRAEALAEQLATESAQKARTGRRGNAQSKALTTELRALKLLQDEPGLRKPRMGGEFARKLGVSPATGRRLHARLTAQQEPAEPVSERSADRDE